MFLFSYGIFENPFTTHGVMGRPTRMEPATLIHYRKVMTSGPGAKLNWWIAVPDNHSNIKGTLIHDVNDKDWEEFDLIEDVGDGWYERQRATVMVRGAKLEVYVYGAGQWARSYIAQQ